MNINVKVLRSKAYDESLTQKEIAKRSGLSLYAVSKVFNGKSVRESTLKKVADCLGLRLSEVIVITD